MAHGAAAARDKRYGRRGGGWVDEDHMSAMDALAVIRDAIRAQADAAPPPPPPSLFDVEADT